jgi:hypothetical protein
MVYTEASINWAEVADAQRNAVWTAVAEDLHVEDEDVEGVDLDRYPPDVLVEAGAR